MAPAFENSAPAMSGIEPRDERDLRIWSAIAMWLGGGCAIAAGALLLGSSARHFIGLLALAGFCIAAAATTFAGFRSASNPTLYVLTNIFSTLGALTVWLACLWSGGPSSSLIGLYFFPVLYDAYFFRAREAVPHLVLNTMLAASPLLYAESLHGTQFPGRIAVIALVMVGMSAVVGNRKRHLLDAELNSRRQALSDPLTGLHNLRSLRAVAARRKPSPGAGVLVIDIDDFKAVNTRYGHTGADELLRRVGAELLALSDERDCVARIGGDEFAVFVHGRTQVEIEALTAACGAAVRRASASIGGEGAAVSASVGHAIYPRDGRAFSELLASADDAMYVRKAALRRVEIERPTVVPPALLTFVDDSRRRREHHSGTAVGGSRLRLAEGATAGASGAGGPLGWLRGRPANSLAGAAAWLSAAATTLIVMLLPDTDNAHRPAVLALIGWATLMAALVLLVAPAIGRRAYVVSDAIAVPGIAAGVYFTGGTTSPLLPLMFLGVTAAACFSPPRGTLLHLLGAVVVFASPFAYASAEARLEFSVRFIALVTTACVLVGIVLYNRRELAQAEQASRELASHDPLTGLPNRRAFERRVTGALRTMTLDPAAVMSVSIIDLDNFKRVNDVHGHAAGDRVLKAIASALTAITRREDSLTRIGGDEFALVAEGVDGTVSQALGERCVKAVEEAVAQAGYGDCEVSATVGYAIFPHHGRTLDALVENADSALMQAKSAGKRAVAAAAGPPAHVPAG
jgi:diguanylate cyclase (GGDEF)-like protein